MPKSPAIGQAAPDFTLPGVLLADGAAERRDFALSAQRGRPLVLAFYPGDETSVCTKQMCSYSAGLDRFAARRHPDPARTGDMETFDQLAQLALDLGVLRTPAAGDRADAVLRVVRVIGV